MAGLKKTFTQIKSQLEAAEKEKPPDEGFIAVLSPFYSDNIEKCLRQEEITKEYEKVFVDKLVSLGEELKKVKGEKSSVCLEPYDKMFTKIRGMYNDVL